MTNERVAPSQIVAMQSIKENLDAGFTLKADVQKLIKTTSFKKKEVANMHNINDKICPMMKQNNCLLKGCAFFWERLNDCGVNVLAYNLYQLNKRISALLNEMNRLPAEAPAVEYEKPADHRLFRPTS